MRESGRGQKKEIKHAHHGAFCFLLVLRPRGNDAAAKFQRVVAHKALHLIQHLLVPVSNLRFERLPLREANVSPLVLHVLHEFRDAFQFFFLLARLVHRRQDAVERFAQRLLHPRRHVPRQHLPLIPAAKWRVTTAAMHPGHAAER
jgi:hypothetical protein